MPDCSAIDRAWGEFTPDERNDSLKLRTKAFSLDQEITRAELDGCDLESLTRPYRMPYRPGVA